MPTTLWLKPERYVAAIVPAVLALMLAATASAQSKPEKHEGKIVCGSFSGDPKNFPAWNDAMEISIEGSALVATPARERGQTMRGLVGRSGAILLAGEGGPPGGAAEWTYEFAGKLNPKGTTVLKGELADIKGGSAKRMCAISF